jgi:hypothetical protein
MNCVNKRCPNKLHEGSGSILQITPVKQGTQTPVMEWMCSPCLNSMRREGFFKERADRDLWIRVVGDQLQMTQEIVRPEHSYPYLYTHWKSEGGWRDRKARFTDHDARPRILVYTTPELAAKAYPESPVCVFMPEELTRIPFHLAAFAVDE